MDPQQPSRPSSPVLSPNPRLSRATLRGNLSSFFRGSSVYSNNPSLDGSPAQKPGARFHLSVASIRGSRNMTANIPSPRTTRSRSSTRSLIDAAALPVSNVQPFPLPAHEDPLVRPASSVAAPISLRRPGRVFSGASLEDMVLQQETRPVRRRGGYKHKARSRIFSKAPFREPKVRMKATMSIAFGVTLLTALSLYLGLSIARIGSGVMFHSLFILLILALTIVFCHSLLRMVMCILDLSPSNPRNRRRGRRNQRHAGLGDAQAETIDVLRPEKPIRIIMIGDEEEALEANGEMEDIEEKIGVRPPPPVYGEYRSSKRMNPSLVHWQKLPPSPLTPTYDEAMNDVQRALGFRPPSYLSETGVGVAETQPTEEVVGLMDPELSVIHPLERERLAQLVGIAR